MGCGKRRYAAIKMQTTWKLEYLTTLFLALVVDSDGSSFFWGLSSHLCGTMLRFFTSGTITTEILEKELLCCFPNP
ncbi:hypothetical protein HID58_081285, partial [Brassica napus]